jgi:hypothetical protein
MMVYAPVHVKRLGGLGHGQRSAVKAATWADDFSAPALFTSLAPAFLARRAGPADQRGRWASYDLFLTGGLLAGAGAGVLFKGAVATTAGLAGPEHRAEALAALFLAAYVGLALPVLGLGLAHGHVADRTALGWFAVALALLCTAAAPRRLVRLQSGD